ncbi:hypothetical protein HUN08_13155 [Gordonia sp. X0973]|uniref:DUF6319 family protein n=1 Tax=Gordonia sp. X0973 TaxID=2742602 RepID=UPI000F532EEF|nr:DUF6319 family protein [Gordonia sp. X0973]QKT08024.1 hypothetical protein HUN08_13155 [Gordonia sp. X0973]
MPPRSRQAADSLTPEDLAALAAAVADGKRATVYLRDAIPGLRLAAGSPAKVVSIDGSTVTVRPSGVDDELPYEAEELRLTKAAPAKAGKSTKAAAPKPVATKPAPAPPRAVPAPAPAPRKSAAKPKSVTVTIFGSTDNEWSVSVTAGGRKPNQSRGVTPAAAENALRELGDDAALRAAESVLRAAREEAERKVEELSRELAAAKQTLAALSGEDADD